MPCMYLRQYVINPSTHAVQLRSSFVHLHLSRERSETNMASSAIAALGWQTLGQVTSAGINPAFAGLFLSPISLYIALVLALNGAGTRVVLLWNHAYCLDAVLNPFHCGCRVTQHHPAAAVGSAQAAAPPCGVICGSHPCSRNTPECQHSGSAAILEHQTRQWHGAGHRQRAVDQGCSAAASLPEQHADVVQGVA